MEASTSTLSYSILQSNASGATADWRDNRNIPWVSFFAQTSEYYANTFDKQFATHFAKLKALGTERALWPDGAERPSQSALTLGYVVLRQFLHNNFLPTRVVASAEGGIAICFVCGDKYSDVECFNTGTVLGVVTNRRNRPNAWEIQPSESHIAQAAATIQQFFLGASTTKDDSGNQGR
jgi:hypothetical protein